MIIMKTEFRRRLKPMCKFVICNKVLSKFCIAVKKKSREPKCLITERQKLYSSCTEAWWIFTTFFFLFVYFGFPKDFSRELIELVELSVGVDFISQTYPVEQIWL